MMAAATVLVILLGILVAVMNSVSKTVRSGSSKIDAYAATRAAFSLLGQKVSQATLNTYWEYDNPTAPTVYRRQSDLQFLVIQNTQKSGYGQEIYFPSPQAYSSDTTLRSTEGLLNACSFFVRYDSDQNFRPSTQQGPLRYRYRLMQALQPTENFAVYKSGLDATATEAQWTAYWTAHAWTTDISNTSTAQFITPLADNVIAMIIWPRLTLADDEAGTLLASHYIYDSKDGQYSKPQKNIANQLPPTLHVTLVTISEASAAALNMGSTPPTVIESALNNKFTDVTQYQQDLVDLASKLDSNKIDYTILNTTVILRESKWSTENLP